MSSGSAGGFLIGDVAVDAGVGGGLDVGLGRSLTGGAESIGLMEAGRGRGSTTVDRVTSSFRLIACFSCIDGVVEGEAILIGRVRTRHRISLIASSLVWGGLTRAMVGDGAGCSNTSFGRSDWLAEA